MLKLVVLLLSAALSPAGAALRAAAVKIDITPQTPQWLMGYAARQSTGVHDRIYHRIAVLDDGVRQVYLVASDLCVYSPSVYDEVAARVEKETGAAPRQFWWTVTHTHSAPEVGPPDMYDVLLKGRSEHAWNREYYEFIASTLVDGIREARRQLTPARAAAGVGMARANINRRARDLDGTISLGLNPDGPVDRQIGLLRLERATDGSTLALIANYAMHGTVMSGKFVQISGDGPGVVAAYLEEKLNAPVLYINGAAGDIAPIYSVQPDPKAGHLGEFRVLLGDKILDAHRALGPGGADVTLDMGETWIETPRKEGLSWPASLARYAAKSAGGADLVRIPVRFVRVGDTVLWGAPVELFCEIAIRVRNESPFRNTFFFGYANGWLGYLPTAAAFREGGYEPRTSPFTPQVERDFGDAVVIYLSGMARR
jgi:neutral ceramidase